MTKSYQVIRITPGWVTAAEIAADYPILRRWLAQIGSVDPENVPIVTATVGGYVELIVKVPTGFFPAQEQADTSGTIQGTTDYIDANW